jgi:hypothetical protein
MQHELLKFWGLKTPRIMAEQQHKDVAPTVLPRPPQWSPHDRPHAETLQGLGGFMIRAPSSRQDEKLLKYALQ